jgi:hypothetical protein
MVSSGMLCRVALVRTHVSEELSASFIKVTRIGELGITLRSVRRLLVTSSVVHNSPILVTLMMEALSSSETSVLTRATRRNIPEDTMIPSACKPGRLQDELIPGTACLDPRSWGHFVSCCAHSGLAVVCGERLLDCWTVGWSCEALRRCLPWPATLLTSHCCVSALHRRVSPSCATPHRTVTLQSALGAKLRTAKYSRN